MKLKSQDEIRALTIQILSRMQKTYNADFPPAKIAEIALEIAEDKVCDDIYNQIKDLDVNTLIQLAGDLTQMHEATMEVKKPKTKQSRRSKKTVLGNTTH
ncbi:hypothetical protein GOV11_04230 [Candidatus Woesearchaeota archaeon]|nr:hypothetical protein [Candidatus Woesearchaeota archaeon]